MSTSFKIAEHVIDAQHIREYPRATAFPDAPLKLCIKQYTPRDNVEPQPGDVTIIAAHGTGFPKELYEPLWAELLARASKNGVRIRAIWAADAVNQGASGIMNEQALGNDPSWYDHSRDLIHMINHFRDQMPRPIMGVGHSLGATQLVYASIFHPRLFTSLLLIEPYMIENVFSAAGPQLLAITSFKPDVWPSREIATENARKLLRSWDPRVQELWTKFGYRDLPTAIYPNSTKAAQDGKQPVTLTTTKYQEALIYYRLNTQRHTELGLPEPAAQEHAETSPPHDPLSVPDMLGPLFPGQRGYRTEPMLAMKFVSHLRPSVLYLSGSYGPLHRAGIHAEAAKRTGTRFGGSGGMEYDRVRHVVVDQAGHIVPFEKIAATADALGQWIQREVQLWRHNESRIADGWQSQTLVEKSTFPPGWFNSIPESGMKSKI